MNERTAKHLNHLRALAMPVVLSEANVPTGDVLVRNCGPSTVAKRLEERLKPILHDTEPSVIAAEIRDAAAERRDADVCNPEFLPYFWKRDATRIPWYFTARLWAACRPQILAVIEADNAERAAAYEAYRVACEQGVAVPPVE